MYQSLSPAQLIDNLLKNSEPRLQAQVLERARLANQRLLDQLQEERLHVEESGWVDYWSQRYERTTETLAEIQRVLGTLAPQQAATC